jgi:hypothetical protein
MSPGAPRGWASTLQRFAGTAQPAERCELCGQGLPAVHPHLLKLPGRQIRCACPTCAARFSERSGSIRRIPGRAESLAGLRLSDRLWESLQIPIDLAFFVYGATGPRVTALYPGPAGVVESQLPLHAWADLERESPVLLTLAPEVESLAANRMDGVRDYYRLPIDRCFALVGQIRSHWRGPSGGPEAKAAVAEFFAALAAGDRPPAAISRGSHPIGAAPPQRTAHA